MEKKHKDSRAFLARLISTNCTLFSELQTLSSPISSIDCVNKSYFSRDRWIEFIYGLQDNICGALESIDGKAKFREDIWKREEGNGGGGKTRVIANGNVFEKGGVNTSVVFGDVSEAMRRQLDIDGHKWFACGLSLVLHQLNPYVPTVHANWRYFE